MRASTPNPHHQSSPGNHGSILLPLTKKRARALTRHAASGSEGAIASSFPTDGNSLEASNGLATRQKPPERAPGTPLVTEIPLSPGNNKNHITEDTRFPGSDKWRQLVREGDIAGPPFGAG